MVHALRLGHTSMTEGLQLRRPPAQCRARAASRCPCNYRDEQYDSDRGLYYLRARYYNPTTGRFMSRDPEDGSPRDPKTLHKYLYAGGDPVNGWDPTGRAELVQPALILLDVVIKNALAVTAITAGAVCILNEATELIQGLYTDLGAPVKSITFGFCSAKVRKSRWTCEAGGHYVNYRTQVTTISPSFLGYGNTESDACQAAISNFQQSAPPGSYTRHPRCRVCYQR